MRLSSSSPKENSRRARKRLGRGISAGQGASCGKGMRGQKSRSGPGVRAGFEGGQIPLYRRVPKLKHFTEIKSGPDFFILNIFDLSDLEPNSIVNLSFLVEKGFTIPRGKVLKVLGGGEISVPLTVYAAAFTGSAEKKIKAAGGVCVSEA